MTIKSNNLEPQDENEEFMDSLSSIEHFYSQIKSVPRLTEKVIAINQALLSHFQDIRLNAETIVHRLKEQKEELLKHYEGWLLPAAKEVLEELSKDTENLNLNLDDALRNFDAKGENDWIDHAKQWVQIYAKWQDHKSIDQKILKVASDKNQALIDRDIKVIHDYTNQTLSHLSEKSEEFKSLEHRLKVATEESLRELAELKKRPVDQTPKQISDWIENLHRKRETYFDGVLMRIDSIVKDTVQTEEKYDTESFPELEGEILFMERELHHINEIIPKMNLKDEKEVNYIEIRLEGLKEHMENLDFFNVPKQIKDKVDKLYNMVAVTAFRLKDK